MSCKDEMHIAEANFAMDIAMNKEHADAITQRQFSSGGRIVYQSTDDVKVGEDIRCLR